VLNFVKSLKMSDTKLNVNKKTNNIMIPSRQQFERESSRPQFECENIIDLDDELSQTLMERRKRLHELASEINQWEDESVKNIANDNNQAIASTPPIAPPIDSLINSSQKRSAPSSYCSPKFQIMSFSNNNKSMLVSPSPLTTAGTNHNNNNSSSTNKENSSPYPTASPNNHKTLNSNLKSNQNSASKLDPNEIMTAANRMLTKRELILSKCNLKPKQVVQEVAQTDSEANSFKNIKNKFESLINKEQQQAKVQMTPKLIIKRFEELTRETPASIQEKRTSLNQKTHPPSLNTTVTIDQSHITPKSIINKFEQLLANNNNNNNTPKVLSQQDQVRPQATATQTHSIQSLSNRNKRVKTTTPSPSNSQCTVTASLTIVSSIVHSPDYGDNLNDFEEDEDENEEDSSEFGDNDCQIIRRKSNTNSQVNNDDTSLFEETRDLNESCDDDTATINTNTYETQETYSLSSDYTGSFMNQEEFEDEDQDIDQTNQTQEEEEEEDVYIYHDMRDTTQSETTYDITNNNNNNNDNNDTESTCSTLYCSSQMDDEPPPPPQPSNQIQQANPFTIEHEPLFSINDYRRQKRRNNGRRSSIVPRQSLLPNSNSNGSAPKLLKSKLEQAITAKALFADEQLKKSKILERIKELEDLIKQEENVIHQTGIALERCLTDTHFTGSSEHIECNRLLLISCQKRQAYVTEISRQKTLSLNLASQVKKVSTSKLSSLMDQASGGGGGGIDLTGLLIFSDLQLPIKESYISRLKSGDEKRVFYFLCLIRNGIQVLQTQVISVQELIATRETSITFPNRMAISNVDINFKVKIDVYTLEVLPKDTKHSSGKHHSGHSATSKFFSPFKSFHQSSSSSSGVVNNVNSHSNHHYNEPNVLGNGGSKTSNFIHVDTIEICNRDIYNNKFKLSISSSSIPLTGVLHVNVRCMPSKSIELKGFMSLFEDVNGLNSWDRRWCFLNNYNISYWKYPEDEYRNGPLGIINLTKCINEKVHVLPRDICARKYSIELTICETTETSAANDDLNNEKAKLKRYRLSADSKDQVNDWVTNINYALANLRLWNPKAIKPIKK
jgi:actin-binding protein anillin